MSEDRKFYVYVIFRPNGLPCYVGKGFGGRWKRHSVNSHNHHLRNIYRKFGPDLPIVKVREFISDFEAIETEVALISIIGRQKEGGPLVNMTNGGEGASGIDDDVKERLSKTLKAVWKNDELRQRLLTPEAIAKRVAGKRTPEARLSAREKAKSSASAGWETRRANGTDKSGSLKQAASLRARYEDPVFRARTASSTKVAMSKLLGK